MLFQNTPPDNQVVYCESPPRPHARHTASPAPALRTTTEAKGESILKPAPQNSGKLLRKMFQVSLAETRVRYRSSQLAVLERLQLFRKCSVPERVTKCHEVPFGSRDAAHWLYFPETLNWTLLFQEHVATSSPNILAALKFNLFPLFQLSLNTHKCEER